MNDYYMEVSWFLQIHLSFNLKELLFILNVYAGKPGADFPPGIRDF